MKKNLPKILFVSGVLMPVIGPLLMWIIVFFQNLGREAIESNSYTIAVMRGIYFGIMFGIAMVVISKIIKIRQKEIK